MRVGGELSLQSYSLGVWQLGVVVCNNSHSGSSEENYLMLLAVFPRSGMFGGCAC